MKHKLLLLAFVLLLAVTAQAQTYDSLSHPNGRYQMDIRNMMELRDGGIVANVQLFNCTASGGYESDYGCRLYKAVRDENGITVTDSLTIEDPDMNYFLLTRNPFGDDNILAKVERNFNSCSSELVIRFFTDDMSLEAEKEVRVVVADTLQPPLNDCYMLDPEGNIMAYFTISSRKECHFLRADLNGNVIDHVVMPQSSNPVKVSPAYGLFSESPRQYYLHGDGQSNSLAILVLDSLLQPVRTITPNEEPFGYYLEYDSFYQRNISWDDTTMLLLTTYFYDPGTGYLNETEYGVVICKMSKADGRIVETRVIPSANCVYPVDAIKSNDGCVYISYYGSDDCTTEGTNISVFKLGKDMKTIWEQHCFKGINPTGRHMIVTDDNSLAIVGDSYVQESTQSYTYLLASEVDFLVVNDNNFSIREQEMEELPYTFYPNPANDELNLNISPEVEPSLIELYDIQGRMVRSQQSGFETISLHGLPAGTYALRVSMKDGKQYTSAVVKK